MNIPATWFESPVWLAAGWTMLHFLWVAAAIGAVTAVGMQGLRSAAPQVRYLFALGCFALLALAPFGLAVWEFDNVPAADAALVDRQQPVRSITTVSSADGAIQEAVALIDKSGESAGAANGHAAGPADMNRSHTNRIVAAFSTWFDAAARFLPGLWLCGAPLTFVLLATGFVGAERLRRDARLPDDAAIVDLLKRLQRSLHISRRVTIGVCDRIAGPILIGIVRPMILLPTAALTGWSPEQIEMVLLHELAHVRRWDNLVNLVQRIVESLLFFHPVVWWVSNLVRREREHCCDQLVVERSGRPELYAKTLAVLAERRSTLLETLAASAAAQTTAGSPLGEHHLTTRIRRILKRETEPMQVSRKTLFIVPVVLLTAVAIVTWYGLAAGYADSSGETRNSIAEDKVAAPLGIALEPSESSPGPVVDGPAPGVVPPLSSPTHQPSATHTTQIRFIGPTGMQIGWKTQHGYAEKQLVAPARYSFHQGYVYRLKLTNFGTKGHEGVVLYPTLQVDSSHPTTGAYLSHNSVPLELTGEDLDQIKSNNLVTKVIYLPDARYQELAVAGIETLVSTRLDPGVDPVAEADRRGAIVAVLRLGNVDLKEPAANDNSPATVERADPRNLAPPVPTRSIGSDSSPTPRQSRDSTTVGEAAPAKAEDGSSIRDISGIVEYVDRAKLTSHRTGILAAVDVKEGDRVKKGQTLASLGEDELRAARVELEIAVTEYKGLSDGLKRVRELAQQEVIPSEELRKSELKAQLAELEIKKREQQLATLQKQIEALFDGMVTRVYKRPGESVQPGVPIVELVGLQRIRIRAHIDYRYASIIAPSNPVTFQVHVPDAELPIEREIFHGTLSFISPVVDSVTHTVKIHVDARNRDGLLREGLSVRMTIPIVRNAEDLLRNK